MAPFWHPKGSKNPLKFAPPAKALPRGPKRAQEAPQEGSKRLQEGPQRCPGAPKRAPRPVPRGPKTPKIAPWHLKTAQDQPKRVRHWSPLNISSCYYPCNHCAQICFPTFSVSLCFPRYILLSKPLSHQTVNPTNLRTSKRPHTRTDTPPSHQTTKPPSRGAGGTGRQPLR